MTGDFRHVTPFTLTGPGLWQPRPHPPWDSDPHLWTLLCAKRCEERKKNMTSPAFTGLTVLVERKDVDRGNNWRRCQPECASRSWAEPKQRTPRSWAQPPGDISPSALLDHMPPQLPGQERARVGPGQPEAHQLPAHSHHSVSVASSRPGSRRTTYPASQELQKQVTLLPGSAAPLPTILLYK